MCDDNQLIIDHKVSQKCWRTPDKISDRKLSYCRGTMCHPTCIWFFSTKPWDWLGRTSPKCPTLCRLGRKTTTRSVNLYLALSLKVTTLELCRDIWHQKTTVHWLIYGVVSVILCLVILVQLETYQNSVLVSAPKLTYNVVSSQFQLQWQSTSTLSVFGQNCSADNRK